jgi:predicted oxidoreductase
VAGGALIDPRPASEERVRRAAALVAQLAEAKGTSREAIALAWLLRHPAPIQPLVGTTNVERLLASCQADAVRLTREEWYALYVAGRGGQMP